MSRAEFKTLRVWVGLQAGRGLLAAILIAAATTLGGSSASLADGDGSVRVMTRNLYQGADLTALVTAGSLPALVAAAGQALADIRAGKPAERAAAVAREIVRNRVDLVGLQEATIVRVGPISLPPDPSAALPETDVESDGLQSLLKELARLGEPFQVVAIVPGVDAQLPTSLGVDARLTGRIAIIARARANMKLSNLQVQGFLRNVTFNTLGGPIVNARGWASVDVEKNGRKFRFATTHLDADNPGIRSLQAIDMIAGAGNTSLPTVFVADFNVTATSAADATYAQFPASGFVDAWARKRPLDPGFTCCQAPNLLNPASQLDQRIDLIFVRGGFVVDDIHRVGEQPFERTPSGLWPSDHAGVVATLRIPRH
jgi:endonuclease/exonuclease/phosphatase family metal-dependent hydrolase